MSSFEVEPLSGLASEPELGERRKTPLSRVLPLALAGALGIHGIPLQASPQEVEPQPEA
jgi:hypothetical protein